MLPLFLSLKDELVNINELVNILFNFFWIGWFTLKFCLESYLFNAPFLTYLLNQPRIINCPIQCCLNLEVISLCNVGQARSIQHFMSYFSAKRWLCAFDLHCTNNFLVQCCLIALGQNYTSKNYMQCCVWGSRQHCTGKIPGNVVWTSLHSVYIY